MAIGHPDIWECLHGMVGFSIVQFLHGILLLIGYCVTFPQGAANRRAAKFKMDPLIPVEFSAQNSDYKDSGWSRGHMSPAGNNKMSQVCLHLIEVCG